MDLLTTDIQGRPLSPIVEELVSHYESNCGGSIQDGVVGLSDNTDEKGQCCDDTAKPTEQCAGQVKGARLSADDATTVLLGTKDLPLPNEAVATAEEESRASWESAKTALSSKVGSSEGLAKLNHGRFNSPYKPLDISLLTDVVT